MKTNCPYSCMSAFVSLSMCVNIEILSTHKPSPTYSQSNGSIENEYYELPVCACVH